MASQATTSGTCWSKTETEKKTKAESAPDSGAMKASIDAANVFIVIPFSFFGYLTIIQKVVLLTNIMLVEKKQF